VMRRGSTMRVSSLVGILALAVVGVVRAEVKQVSAANDAIYFSKSTEIAVMGMFAEAKGAEFDAFMTVAKEFDKKGGIAMGYTTEKSVYSRYLEDDGKPPSIIVFSSFNPETGEVQKGKKARTHFAGKFTYAELYKFVLVESQPILLRLPQNLGPDFQKRMILAFGSGMPKLFVFGKASDEASDDVVAAARNLRSKALCFYFSVNPSDSEDEGAMHMEQMGFAKADVEKGLVAAMIGQEAPEKLEWDGTSGDKLESAANAFIEDQPPYEPPPPAAGAKGSGGSKGKKKGKAKKEM